MVYPGAVHTRLLHSLGAMHLMSNAIDQLRLNGHSITQDEANGAMAAILLHDIGHGPFSHTLEKTLISNVNHEDISLVMMKKINDELNGQLDTALQIFTNQYPKAYLHQLVSSQLDMDRLDYLSRDSFFCGVSEGIIGAARIIKMLNLHENNLVVEAKGIYSIEKFLVARRLMYWQVYLHKTSVAAEIMLTHILKRAKQLATEGKELFAPAALHYFLYHQVEAESIHSEETIHNFATLDDSDILSSVKMWSSHSDLVLSTLCTAFVQRRLFKVEITTTPQEAAEHKAKWIKRYRKKMGLTAEESEYFFGELTVTTDTYNPLDETISILYKNGTVKDITEVSDMLNIEVLTKRAEKHFCCYYKGDLNV